MKSSLFFSPHLGFLCVSEMKSKVVLKKFLGLNYPLVCSLQIPWRSSYFRQFIKSVNMQILRTLFTQHCARHHNTQCKISVYTKVIVVVPGVK